MYHFFRNKTVVFLSGMPWNYYLHSYRSLFARELAKGNRVFWINPPRRNPLKAIAENRAIKQRDNGVTVFTPWLPKSQYGALNFIDVLLLLLQLRWVVGKLNRPETVFWSVYYSHFEVMPKVPEATKIYWPGDTFEPARELGFLGCYDLVMPLTEAKESVVRTWYPRKAMLSTTGCDFDRFRAAEGGELPAELAQLTKPIAGYVGNISSFRLDFDLMADTAAALPNVSFVYVGAMDRDPQTAAAVDTLKERLANVHFLGHRDYEDLPRYINGFDAGVIPYKLTPFNLGSNPNKVYEYFALGKPAVSVALPSLKKYSGHLNLAQSAEEFAQQLKQTLIDPDGAESRSARIEIARRCSPS